MINRMNALRTALMEIIRMSETGTEAWETALSALEADDKKAETAEE